MDEIANQRWLRVAMFFAIVYPVVGITFGALANPSASNQMRVTWRLAAWLLSAAAFAAHLGYEHFRLRNSPPRAALHVSVAVALGAFALAVWANVHAHLGASSHQSPHAPLALVVFPVVTGAPAFLVALAAGAVLARTRRRSP
jgi:Kef-type K+ transport system membrane component KefB